MGSFDIACGISHTTMHYQDEIGFVILEKNKYRLAEFSVFGVYPHDKYVPAFAPIYGKYNDYGKFKEYTKSSTTKELEKIFGKPISKIIPCVGNYGRNLYDSHSPIFETYFGLNDNDLRLAYSDCDADSELDEISSVLEKLGFSKIKSSEYDLSYSYSDDFVKYRRVKEVIVNLNYDNEKGYLKYGIDDGKVVEYFEFDELLEAIAEKGFYPGYGSLGKQLYRLSKSYGMFFSKNIQDKMMAKPQWLKWNFPKYSAEIFDTAFEELATLAKEAYENRDTSMPDALAFTELTWKADHNYVLYKLKQDFNWNMNSFFPKLVETDYQGLKNDVENLLNLDKILSNTNNYFEPALNGSQHGNSKAEKLLAKSVLELLKEKS